MRDPGTVTVEVNLLFLTFGSDRNPSDLRASSRPHVCSSDVPRLSARPVIVLGGVHGRRRWSIGSGATNGKWTSVKTGDGSTEVTFRGLRRNILLDSKGPRKVEAGKGSDFTSKIPTRRRPPRCYP